MADNMMRIAGRSDSGLAKSIKTDENGVLKMQVEGRKEETQIVLPLQIRRATTTSARILKPVGAIGFIAGLELKSAWTGTVTKVSLRARAHHTLTDAEYVGLESPAFPGSGLLRPMTLFMIPGADISTLSTYYRGKIAAASLPAYGYYDFAAIIEGTFTEGQGVNCELWVRWIY